MLKCAKPWESLTNSDTASSSSRHIDAKRLTHLSGDVCVFNNFRWIGTSRRTQFIPAITGYYLGDRAYQHTSRGLSDCDSHRSTVVRTSLRMGLGSPGKSNIAPWDQVRRVIEIGPAARMHRPHAAACGIHCGTYSCRSLASTRFA